MTEEQVQTLITERLLAFEEQLVRDGRIPRGYPPEPPRGEGSAPAPEDDTMPGLDDAKVRALRATPPRHGNAAP